MSRIGMGALAFTLETPGDLNLVAMLEIQNDLWPRESAENVLFGCKIMGRQVSSNMAKTKHD